MEVAYQDASGNDTRTTVFTIPSASAPGATVVGLITAMMTTRATETGSNVRKLNFRVLGYLADQGLLTGVTLVP